MVETIALITTFVTLVTAVVVFLTKLNRGMREIHVLVNDRMTEAIVRIDQLIDVLVSEGVAVPPRREKDI